MIDTFASPGYLSSTRSFPEDLHQLTIEVNRSYVDVARNVNNRTIGFFTLNRSIETGEKWTISSSALQKGYRQVYTWSDSNLSFSHGIQFSSLTNFVRIWGIFQDGSGNYQTLPYVDVSSATNQISVEVTSSNIVITKGAGAPSCSNGIIVVEWIGNP